MNEFEKDKTIKKKQPFTAMSIISSANKLMTYHCCAKFIFIGAFSSVQSSSLEITILQKKNWRQTIIKVPTSKTITLVLCVKRANNDILCICTCNKLHTRSGGTNRYFSNIGSKLCTTFTINVITLQNFRSLPFTAIKE